MNVHSRRRTNPTQTPNLFTRESWRSALAAFSWLIGSGVVAAASTASAGELSKHLTNAALIERLSDDSFSARQEAARTLCDRGLQVAGDLQKAQNNRDPEVRRRIKAILAFVHKSDYLTRLEKFEADVDGRQEHYLPGWERFRQLVGAGLDERKLFSSMHRTESRLMLALQQGPEEASAALDERCQEFQDTLFTTDEHEKNPLTLGTAAALYFVGSDPHVPIGETASAHISNLVAYIDVVDSALANPRTEIPVRRLLGAWVAREAPPILASQNFSMAMQYNLREALIPAVSILKQAAVDAEARQIALHVVGRFGGAEHRPLLESLLTDETAYLIFDSNPKKPIELQIRDLALVMLLHMTQQDPKQYGFSSVERDAQWVFIPGNPRFSTTAKRQAAFKKWTQWAKLNPAS